MGPVKLKVSTSQQECFAGSVVDGGVEVEVCTKNDKESSAGELKLRLVGLVKTTVEYTTRRGDDRETRTAREEKEILSHEVQLGSFGGKAASGVHNFSFSIALPAGLPPSMTESNGRGSCCIRYSFEAHLHRPGLLNFDAKDASVLRVLGTPQQAGAAVPVTAGPATQPVKFCCCFNRGSMSIGFRMERTVVGFNDSVWLNVAARNNSTSSVNQMLIQLKQETTWTAHGHFDSRTRTIASVVVPGSELGALQWAAGEGTERGQSVAIVESNARQELERQLSTEASTRYQLTVPETSLLTMEALNVRISHSVGVVLDTPCCIGAPAVWTPLFVQTGATGAEVQSGEKAFVPMQASSYPSPQTSPYSTRPYGSAQTVPYPNPQSATYGASPGIPYDAAPGAQYYPPQHAVPYASTVEIDENGNVQPGSGPQGG